MQGKNVSKICAPVINFFTKTVQQANKAVKFVKRKSKLTAQLFCEVLICGCLSDSKISLERMCEMLKERGIKITKQGLHQRFNDEAILLMQNLFERSIVQFKTEKIEVVELLKPFSSVKITDSSGISLPNNLKKLYKGLGGSASEAGMKLQLTLDYLYGQVSAITMTEGAKSDQGFTQYLDGIEKGALYLQDLGYFKMNSFAKIHNSSAYFVSRHLYATAIFDKENKRINLLDHLKNSKFISEEDVFLGEQEKIPVRLIAFRLSDEAVGQRIRKMRRALQKKKKTPSPESLKFARWSIYITNIPKKTLNMGQVHLIYTVRWQIELFFKLCKSDAGIDKVSGRSSSRVVCEIYAKLICIVQFLYFCFPLQWKEKNEISFQKAFKSLKTKGRNFFVALTSPYRLFKFMEKFISDVMDFGIKDKYRNKRKSTFQKLMNSGAEGAVA